MSSNGLVEDARLNVEHNHAIVATLTRQLEVAVQNANASEEQLSLIEKEEANVRKAKFVEDLDDACFICQTKFSDTAGLPSFSVVSLSCPRCTGNAKMVHLKCWSRFPAGEEKCGSCKSPVHLVDEEGNVLKVTVEICVDPVQAMATAEINEFIRQNPVSTIPAPPRSRLVAPARLALAEQQGEDDYTNPFGTMFRRRLGSNLPAPPTPPRVGGMFTRNRIVQQGSAAAAVFEQRAAREPQNQGRAYFTASGGLYVPPPNLPGVS